MERSPVYKPMQKTLPNRKIFSSDVLKVIIIDLFMMIIIYLFFFYFDFGITKGALNGLSNGLEKKKWLGKV